MYLTSGYANVTFRSVAMAGYREQQTACGFSISGWDPADINDIYTEWRDLGRALGLPTNTVFTGVDVHVGTADPEAPLVYNYTGSDTGTGSSATDPPSSCVLVTKQTALGGRKGRGRMFLPASPSAESFDNGRLNSTYQALVYGEVSGSMANIATMLGGEPFLLHSAVTPSPTAITGWSVSARLAVQRRRAA